MSAKTIVGVNFAEKNQLLLREPRKWPDNSAPEGYSRVTWPLKFHCTPKVVIKQPSFFSLEILQKMSVIQGEIYAEMSTTAAFSDCFIDDPDNSWLELTMTDKDLLLERFDSCFGIQASHASIIVVYLDKPIHFTDLNRHGHTLKCTSQKFPLQLVRRLVFDSVKPYNLQVTVQVEWAM